MKLISAFQRFSFSAFLPALLLLCLAVSALAAPTKALPKKKIKNAPDTLMGQPFIGTVFPAGGERGKTVEVVVSGTNLATELPEAPTTTGTATATASDKPDDWEAGSLRISGNGIKTCLSGTADPKSLRFNVEIDPKAEPGERDARVITKDGVSNRFRFFVGRIPEVNEVEPNNDVEHAQALPPLPVLVNGRIDQSDQDFFRFTAKAGRTIVCTVAARSIIPYMADAVPGWCDPVLTLLDAGGKILQTVNGFRFKPEPLLVFQVPSDGEYVLAVRDVLYRGRSDFIYRLSVGELPVITDVFPLGGKRGTTFPVEIRGFNLPVKTVTCAGSPDAEPRQGLTVFNNGLESNRALLATDALPEINESEPNDSPAQANRVELPVAINGRIGKRGDADYFAFRLKEKQTVVMEVQARRLNSPLDSVLALFNDKGVELAENDDTIDLAEPLMTHHADSRISQTLGPGEYVLRIRDAEQMGGDEYAYRLSIGPLRPNFSLRVTPANAAAGRGDTAILTVAALRRDGFSGEIALSIANLPKGCVVSGTLIPSGQDETAITVTTPPDAPLGVFSPSIVGTGTLGGKPASRKAVPAEPVMQAFATTHNVFTQEFLMDVTEPPLISISTSQPPGKVLEVKQGGEAEITVKVVRKNGTKGGITLVAQKPATGFGVTTPFIAPEKDETTVKLSVLKQVPAGVAQSIILSGVIKGVKRSVSVAPAIAVKVLPSE